MPRRIEGAIDGEAFRAVVTTTYSYTDGSTREQVERFGPYTKPGTAKAQLTAKRRQAEASARHRARYAARPQYDGRTLADVTVEGRVDVSAITWRPLDEEAS